MMCPRLIAFPLLLRALAGLFLLLPLRAAAADDIEALIDQLVAVDSPNTFYAGTFRFTEFPPLDGAPLPEFPLSPDAPADQAAFRAYVRLIELGPAALPHLLAHLDDTRETRTSIPDDLAKSMGSSAFVDFRPGDAREEAAIATAELPEENPGPDFDHLVDDYTLTVGDMCFAAIGMITGRSYYIVVDEFEAQLNSPTRSKEIALAVREKWGATPNVTEFYAQLKADLEVGEARFAISAAKRLLYYFPSFSGKLVLAGLARFMEAHEPGSEDLGDYLVAISWSSDPEIRSALRRFLRTAQDPYQIAAAVKVYGSAEDPRSYQQLMELADRLKERRDRTHVEATRLLLELSLHTFPGRREETITRFLAGAGSYAMTSACLVCKNVEDPPVAALAPLLSNKGPSTGMRYLIKGEGAGKWPKDEDYLPYRICDHAYEAIARALGDEEAVAHGTEAEMNARIADLRERLAGERSGWKFSDAEIEARRKARRTPGRAD